MKKLHEGTTKIDLLRPRALDHRVGLYETGDKLEEHTEECEERISRVRAMCRFGIVEEAANSLGAGRWRLGSLSGGAGVSDAGVGAGLEAELTWGRRGWLVE
jgi:hypothetical protein